MRNLDTVKMPKSVIMSKGKHILRMLLIMILLFVLCFLIVSVLVYTGNSSKSMREELCRKIQMTTEQTCNNVNYRFEQVIEGTSSLLGTIYPFLNEESSKFEQVEEYTEICRTMNEYINKHMISFLRLYVPDKKIYADQISMSYSFHKIKDIPGEKDKMIKGGVFWEPTHNVKFGNGTFHDVLTCSVAVKRLSDYEELAGVLCADIDIDQFYEIFAGGNSDYEHMYLVDENGTILIQGEAGKQDQQNISSNIMKQVNKNKNGYLTTSNMIYAFNKLKSVDWYVISTNNLEKAYTMDLRVVKIIIMAWVALFLILIIVIVAIIYNINLSKTVKDINTAIQILDAEGENKESLKKDSSNIFQKIKEKLTQIGWTALENDAEQIVLSINNIIEGRYRDKLAISEYRMESLQAQIKPHFLYNSLDALKWMIMDENSTDAVWMVNALSKYLRMSINRGDQVVSLKEEVQLMKIYLEIMQRRFRNKFEMAYDLEKETLNYMIPKLSLQPLVENAILHGILHSEKENLRVTIRSWHQDDWFVIQIEDNGCGMKKEQAEYLSNLDIKDGKGYGIANVHNRLNIFARGICRFEIESKEKIGTCVTVAMSLSETENKRLDKQQEIDIL